MPKTSSTAGFTLIEVLVALTIFAIGLISLAGMQMTAIQANTSSQNLTAAVALAEGAMEWFQSLRPDDPLFDADVANQVYKDSPAAIDGAGNFVITYDIDIDAPSTNMATITVHVDRVRGRDIDLTGIKWID